LVFVYELSNMFLNKEIHRKRFIMCF
jgi:hypothetical protein